MDPVLPTDVAVEPPPEAIHKAVVQSRCITILDVFDNVPWFHGPAAADWTAWRAFLCALYGLPMTPREREFFERCTGRTRPPRGKVSDAWVICGRRARKSAIGSLIGVWEGGYRDFSGCLAPGERALIPITAKNTKEARQIHSFASALLAQPGLRHLLKSNPTQDTIELTTDCDLEITACNPMAGRSRAIPCALNDEIAFWPTAESATPDEDVLRGIRGGMANVPDPLMVGMSSPAGESGVLFDRYESHYGRDEDDALVWKADTLTMHDSPTIRVFVAGEYKNDPIGAEAEIGANFRRDIVDFISREAIRDCVAKGRLELSPCRTAPVEDDEEPSDRWNYHAFVDVSGGSSDAFTLSIAHWDPKKGKAVQDLLRIWRPPFKAIEAKDKDGRPKAYKGTKAVVYQVGRELARYGLSWVTGDAYGGEWPRDEFDEQKIGYVVSELTKHEIYQAMLPVLNSRVAELLDDKDQTRELQTLKRRRTPTGQERIDHPTGGTDDAINAGAGALELAYREGKHMRAPAEPKRVEKTTAEIVEREYREAMDQMQGGGANPASSSYGSWATRWEQ